jgi:hypothetical protein
MMNRSESMNAGGEAFMKEYKPELLEELIMKAG